MILKIIGVILIVGGCGGVGFRIAANHLQEENSLRQLIGILDFMECELQYRLTPLPELCHQVKKGFSGPIGNVFFALSAEMDEQISSDLSCCMQSVLKTARNIPPITENQLKLLGRTIGRFDLDGQLKGLEAIRMDCRRNLDALCCNREVRLRSYQTLGLCAGAALAILLI